MLAEPRCYTRACRHFRGVKQDKVNGVYDESTERVICAAYPDGIPGDIAYGDDMHLVRRPDQDNDIVYEPNARGARGE